MPHGPAAVVSLSELDRRIIGLVSDQRVVTSTQLELLLADVPGRTLRYRTEHLHRAGLLGRSRPYRERGSAPYHLWPSRRADTLTRGAPAPRGGERAEPNPLFLAHAAGVTELYALLATQTPGVRLARFDREPREPFTAEGRSRTLAPDALVELHDGQGLGLLAFVELDLGTMSHARLKVKAGAYAAYAAQAAWTERYDFCPCLLFITTTEARAVAFLKMLAALLQKAGRGGFYDDRAVNVSWFAAGACAMARESHRALSAERIVLRQTRATQQFLDRDEVLPAQLGPLLHVHHVRLPVSTTRSSQVHQHPGRLRHHPRGVNLNRRRGVSFPPAPTVIERHAGFGWLRRGLRRYDRAMARLSNSLCAGFVVLIAVALLASPAFSASAPPGATIPGGEFHYPSPSQLPAPSAANTPPACPPTAQNDYDCGVSSGSLPPADANNPEKYVNSAYWPAEERPDIEMYAVMQYGYNYKDCSAVLPHLCFLVDAEAVGYPVSHTPQVGDLWLAPCEDLIWMGQEGESECSNDGYYLGYVQEVLPDGSFIQSWGGSDTPEDFGLAVTWMSAAMNLNTDFIGFMPPGQFPHLAGSPCREEICPANTLPPGLSSMRPSVGRTITTTAGTWTGMPPITYAYQWDLCDASGDGCAAIPGATSISFTPTGSDVGRVLAIVVTGTNEVDSVASYPERTAQVAASGPHSEPRRRGLIERFKLSSFLASTGTRTKRFLMAKYTLRVPSRVTLSIRDEARSGRRGKSKIVLRVMLRAHTGTNIYVAPDSLPRGADCATLTASGRGPGATASSCIA